MTPAVIINLILELILISDYIRTGHIVA